MNAPKADEDFAATGITPVYILDTKTWMMDKKDTTDDGPGIIYKHEARLDEGVLRILATKAEELWAGTMRGITKHGKYESIKVGFGEVWELDIVSWTRMYQANEWVTVEKKKNKTKGGHRG
jgi:hypothetical protein